VIHRHPVSRLIAPALLIIVMTVAAAHAGGTETAINTPLINLPDSALGEIAAQGISVGGDLTNTCMTGSDAICFGTFELNDNHQFDSSDHKGAIEMSGNVQQNVSAQINVNQTQGSTATGVTLLNTPSISNTTLTISNSNNATNFVGGF
jgi:hypothetical protein